MSALIEWTGSPESPNDTDRMTCEERRPGREAERGRFFKITNASSPLGPKLLVPSINELKNNRR